MEFFKAVWKKADKKKVFGIGGLLLAILIAEITLTCFIPEWKRAFFNVIENKLVDKFSITIAMFLALMLGLGATQGLKRWIGQLFSWEFRRAGSKLLLKTWTKGGKSVRNYTQAQTEALRYVTEIPVVVAIEVIISLAIVIFLIIANMDNPTIIVSSLVYTGAVILVAALFNKPLVTKHKFLQEAEGLYRESLGDIENDKGDFSSKAKFLQVALTYFAFIKTNMYFTLFSTLKGSLTSVLPYLLMSGAYFNGAISLGEFMSVVSTFELIVINSTILVQFYPETTKVAASLRIVNEFYKEVANEV